MEVTEENVVKLKKLLTLMDEDSVTNEDFIQAFEKMVALIQQLHKDNSTEFDGIHRAVQVLGDKLKKDTVSEFATHKKEAQLFIASEVNKLRATVDSKLSSFDQRINDLPQVDEQALLEKFLSEVPKVEPQKLYTAEEVRNLLESLKEDERLDFSSLKNLPKSDGSIKGVLTASALYSLADVDVSGITAGQTIQWTGIRWIPLTVAAAGTAVYEEVPTDTGDHTNFTLAHSPLAGTFRLYRGGARQQVTSDFTRSGATITLLVPLATGEVLLADYSY